MWQIINWDENLDTMKAFSQKCVSLFLTKTNKNTFDRRNRFWYRGNPKTKHTEDFSVYNLR